MKNKTVPTSNRKKTQEEVQSIPQTQMYDTSLSWLDPSTAADNSGVKEAAWAQDTPS